jgi:hypothetical protein
VGVLLIAIGAGLISSSEAAKGREAPPQAHSAPLRSQ